MLILILALLSVVSTSAVEVQTPVSTSAAPDRVTIQRRRIVLVRPASVAKQFPERKTAVVIYPIIGGLRDAKVLQRVRSLLAFKNIFDYSLAEYRTDPWLSEFSYVVNHNGDHMLDITYTQSGVAAYPDEQQKHFLIDIRDGRVVKALDVFEADKLNSLAVMVDRELQREIKQLLNEIGDPEEKESLTGAYDNLKFEVQNIDDFSVGGRGVTFLYDAGFPHVIKAWEPRGRYFFSYAALNEYIKRDGLLGRYKR